MQNPSIPIGTCLPVSPHLSHVTSPFHGYTYYICNEFCSFSISCYDLYSRVAQLMMIICHGGLLLHHRCLCDLAYLIKCLPKINYLHFACLLGSYGPLWSWTPHCKCITKSITVSWSWGTKEQFCVIYICTDVTLLVCYCRCWAICKHSWIEWR